MCVMSFAMGKMAWMHGFVVAMPLATIAAALVPNTLRATRTWTQYALQVTWVAVTVAWFASYAL